MKGVQPEDRTWHWIQWYRSDTLPIAETHNMTPTDLYRFVTTKKAQGYTVRTKAL